MRPTRRTQPYRAGRARVPGSTLSAMLRGGPGRGLHPAAGKRYMQKRRRRIRKAVRRSMQNRA